MPKPISSRIVNRFMNAFTSQSIRRVLRAYKAPPVSIPIILGAVREVNRQIQWGNKALWKQRVEKCKALWAEFREKQNELSPVYRFRGGSNTVSPYLSQETVRDRLRDSETKIKPSSASSSSSYSKLKIDPSTLFLGGLGFVVFASIAGPAIAKRVNTIDPLDARESQIASKASDFGIQLTR